MIMEKTLLFREQPPTSDFVTQKGSCMRIKDGRDCQGIKNEAPWNSMLWQIIAAFTLLENNNLYIVNSQHHTKHSTELGTVF